MSRNSGRTFEIIDGTYKDKIFDVRNKDQKEQFLKQNKLVGKVYSDYPGGELIKENIVISTSKLVQIGWID